MRKRIRPIILTLACLIGPSLSSAGRATARNDITAPVTTPDLILTYYPPAALAAGVEGEATLACPRLRHGAPVDCTVVGERPGNQGFGAAALSLAAHATRNLNMSELTETPYNQLDFFFRLNPPSISPDLLAKPHFAPRWERLPTADILSRLYPAEARRKRIGGNAVLRCKVITNGYLVDCAATATPPGLGFEDAALKLVPYLKVRNQTDDGAPSIGATITLPLRFR